MGVVCGDSSAAIAVAQRKGCGKLRHIRIGQLWIQERVNEKDLDLRKVLGEQNPADLMTKHVNEKKKVEIPKEEKLIKKLFIDIKDNIQRNQNENIQKCRDVIDFYAQDPIKQIEIYVLMMTI